MRKMCIRDSTMNQRINDIIHNYKAGKISPEEANRQLKAEGAGFTLDPEKNPGGGWTQEELEQGFIPAKEGEPWWAPMHTCLLYTSHQELRSQRGPLRRQQHRP